MPAEHRRELCALLNAALRGDDAELLAPAMPLMRGIKSLCVVRGARPEARLRFPPAGVCLRGGGLPDEHRGFFVPGRKYRVPGFLATSFHREARAPPARPPASPPIRVRPRGPHALAAASPGADSAWGRGEGGVQVAERFM